MAIKTVTFNYTGAVQKWTPPANVTKIKIECWGARGGGSMMDGSVNSNGGYGGYVYGDYVFPKGGTRELKIYVGGAGANARYSTAPGGWNGGGSGTYDGRDDEGAGGGGGASDVRTVEASAGTWYDTAHAAWASDASLLSRIIVAGGGGGLSWNFTPGVGGGLVGGVGSSDAAAANQTSGYAFGLGQSAWSYVPDGGNGNVGQGGGGGGWYGGRTSSTYPKPSGCGGSSYYGSLFNPGTTAGVNNGNGKVVITYDDSPTYYCLQKDDHYIIPQAKFFNESTKSFAPLTLNQVQEEIYSGTLTVDYLCKPFTIGSTTYNPHDIINYNEHKIFILSVAPLYKINLNYIPTDIALLKTNIRVHDKYTQVSQGLPSLFLDITSPDKNKIDYFIDYNRDDQDNSRKSCGILNTEVLKYDFFLSLKLDASDAKLQSITLFGKDNDKYEKIKDYRIDVYDNFVDTIYLTFHDNYDMVIANKIQKESATYTINTLDQF